MIQPMLHRQRLSGTQLLSLFGLALLALLMASPAPAADNSPRLEASSWLLVDVTSGQILASEEADTRIEPASLTKLMTAYLAFNAIREGTLTLDQRPPVSDRAYKAIGSRMFVDPLKPATVEELLSGMIIQSGNDASIILAEAISGSEQAFAGAMNRIAQRMGLRNTNFVNATGLPSAEHYSSARDLATLAIRLILDHPDYYSLYSEREYTYNKISQKNRNRLLFIDSAVDGVKTGYTDAAGYCLIASAKRDQPASDFERRLLTVVLGTKSSKARVTQTQKLLNYGFQNFDALRIYRKGQSTGSYRVWKGDEEQVSGTVSRDVIVTIPKGANQRVSAEIERVEPLVAPIEAGQQIGTLRVKLDNQLLLQQHLIAADGVIEGGWFGQLWDGLQMRIAR
ncbi:MAG: D-alanyl-D-alanine carboxypeptidase family protein [Burkholderiaceae bacterium]